MTVLRLWGELIADGRSDDGPWRDGFATAGLGLRAAKTFHALVLLIAGGARRPLDIRRPHDPRLGEDEARLLHVIGLVQHGWPARSECALREFLTPATARVALPYALRLADLLSARQLKIPRRPDEAALRYGFETAHAPQRILNLIH